MERERLLIKIKYFLIIISSFMLGMLFPRLTYAATTQVLASQSIVKIDQKLHQQHFSGTVLAVHNGQPIYVQNFGYANYQANIRNQSQMLYQIGSMQKTLTAVLVMQQVQAKHLQLDDVLAKYYPQIPNSKNITIRMLLDMRSGLQLANLPMHAMTPTQLSHFIEHNLQVKDTGDFDYQDVNYVILAEILSKITHQSYQTLFCKTFLTAYSPSQAVFFGTFNSQSNATCGYVFDKNDVLPNYDWAIREAPRIASYELGAADTYFNIWTLYQIQRGICQGDFIDLTALQQLRNGIQYPHDYYVGGIHNTEKYYWSHGLIAGFESALVISQNGQNAFIMLGNRPTSKYMPTLARNIYNKYVVTPKLQVGMPFAINFFQVTDWPAVNILRPNSEVTNLAQEVTINYRKM